MVYHPWYMWMETMGTRCRMTLVFRRPPLAGELRETRFCPSLPGETGKPETLPGVGLFNVLRGESSSRHHSIPETPHGSSCLRIQAPIVHGPRPQSPEGRVWARGDRRRPRPANSAEVRRLLPVRIHPKRPIDSNVQ